MQLVTFGVRVVSQSPQVGKKNYLDRPFHQAIVELERGTDIKEDLAFLQIREVQSAGLRRKVVNM